MQTIPQGPKRAVPAVSKLEAGPKPRQVTQAAETCRRQSSLKISNIKVLCIIQIMVS